METERSHTTERILNLTLEIMYLLTGENYIAFKLSDGLVTSNLMKTQIPIIDRPSHSLSKDNKKIREFLREIVELLAGEVPVRCQDFSMEEWEDLLGHKDVMMENRLILTSPGGSSNRNPPERCPRPLYSRDSTQQHQEIPQEDQVDGSSNRNPPERCPRPLYSRDSTQEHQEIPQEDQDETQILSVTEIGEKIDETYVIGDDSCKEEEIPPEISTDLEDIQKDIESEDEVSHVRIKEEDTAADFGTGGQYIRRNPENHPIIYPDCDIEDEEDILSGAIKEDAITPNLHPAPYNADLSSGSFTHGGWFSDHFHPVIHHEGPRSIPCPDCGKCFSERSKFVTHRRSHTGEKPFSCIECGKCFKQSAHLVSHHRTHTRVHPYSCSECGKCFSQKSNLIRHEKVHTGVRSFSCTECGKRFSEKSNLIRHEKVHTGEKPYSCSECGRCFSLRANLLAHVRTHTGEKPFSCFACGKCFSRKSVLNIHERVHTGEKPYSCMDCGKCFSKRFLLARHVRLHTEEKSFSLPLMDSFPKEPTSSITRGLTEVLNRFCYQAVDSFHLDAHNALPAGDRRFPGHDLAGE
ncbi:uncharacterized protein ACMZJ9_015390 [Mantella aurantiaca]